jgi:hypothetical protein
MSIRELIPKGTSTKQALRVDITKTEYGGGKKRGPPVVHGCPVHEDGQEDLPSVTTVYVVYTDKASGAVLEGNSADYGGGLNYGNGPSGKFNRGGRGYLTIPSGATYIFPGYFVQHSVAPLKRQGVIRSEQFFSLIVFALIV